MVSSYFIQIPRQAPRVYSLTQWTTSGIDDKLRTWLRYITNKFWLKDVLVCRSKITITPKPIYRDIVWRVNHNFLLPEIETACSKNIKRYDGQATAWIKTG